MLAHRVKATGQPSASSVGLIMIASTYNNLRENSSELRGCMKRVHWNVLKSAPIVKEFHLELMEGVE